MDYESRQTQTQIPGAQGTEAALDDLGDVAARGQSAEILGEGDLTTSGGESTPIKRLLGAPKGVGAGDVVELVDGADLTAERQKTGARYVHLFAGGEEYWLDLGDTPAGDVLDALVTPILGPDGAPRVPLSEAFAADRNSVVATVRPERTIEANTAASRDVLKQSNDKSNAKDGDDALGKKMDEVWDVMNNQRDELEAEELPDERRVGKAKKEGAWYNAIELEGGKPVVHRSPNDPRTDPLPELSLDEYQRMIVRDFDYQGAITKFQAAGGEEAFVAAVLRRHPEGGRALEIAAREVWSYATTGADTGGKTDIAQMQGYLYLIDPKIQASSDSNTKRDKLFNAGTPEDPIMIQGGDGAHGRATILTTRHIIADITFDELEPVPFEPELPPPPTRLDVGPRDRFTHDVSPSMVGGGKGRLAKVEESVDAIRSQNSDGPVRPMADDIVGGFEAYEHYVKAPADPNLGPRQRVEGQSGMREVQDFGVTLEAAFERIYPERSLEDAEQFLGLFAELGTFTVGQFFSVTTSPDGNRYALKGADLQAALGDKGGAQGESSLKSIINVLMYEPEFSDAALDTLAENEKPRLNAVADEEEQGLEYLELAKLLADKLGIEVRIFAVPTNIPTKTIDPQVNVAVVDLQSMHYELDEDPEENDRDEGQMVGTLHFTAWMNGVKTEKEAPITRSNLQAATDKGAPLRGAGAPLVEGQNTPYYAPKSK